MRLTPENWIDALLTYLKANLNTNITAINTANGDTLLNTVDTNAYKVMSLLFEEVNYNPFIYIDVEIGSGVSNGNVQATDYTIQVVIVFESNNDLNDMRRIWRYHSALVKTLESGYDKIFKAHRPQMESLNPIALQFAADSQQRRAIGVNLKVYL